jgi:hypothetical protein
MILVHPPVAKPSEPPAGIARLCGAMRKAGRKCVMLDANIEGLLFLLEQTPASSDTWTKRSVRNLPHHLTALRDKRTYSSLARYSRAVRDVNRVLEATGAGSGTMPGLSNFEHRSLSPLRSRDLIEAAETPERNPFYHYFSKRLLALAADERPSLIGLSLNYLSQAITAFAMIGFIRRELPGLRIVLGGGLVTSWLRRPGWRNLFQGLVDELVAGPGEVPLLGILGYENPAGRYFCPDYASFAPLDYLSPGFILPYSASSGCYWNKCTFCPEKAEENPYIPIPVRRVREDLSNLINKTNPAMLHLLDNAISPSLLKDFAVRPLGVPWYGFARIGRDLTDIDFCGALKLSGCRMLKLGVESGDQDVLESMEKGTDLDMVSRALKTLRKAGIAAYVYLLFGTPYESLASARRTLDFVVKHSDEIGFLNLAVFNMPVCAPEALSLETNHFYDGDLSLYTAFSHPLGWDRKKVRQFLDDEFKKHPAVAAILRREPPLFTSNHAPFFTFPGKASVTGRGFP